MYYLAKIAEITGIVVVAIDFLRHFPEVMNMKVLGAGIILFAFGWIIEKFLLKS